MEDDSFLPGLITAFENSALAEYKHAQEKKELRAIIHSVPLVVMKNAKYSNLFTDLQNVTHIFDNADTNLPVLTTSRAAKFVEQIKMVCPHMFPMVNTVDRIEQEKSVSDRKFDET